jgi:AmiR/NasT family two-component response regulator
MGVATFYQVAGSVLSIDAQVGQFLVNAVGVALVSDPDVLDEDRLTKEESWVTQARIHQATGMVMAQLHLGDDDALALIRAHAYAHNTTLSQICEEILQRHLNFTTTD